MSLEDALHAFRKALEINPNLPEALVGQGAVLGKLKRFDQAAASYRRAIDVNPALEPAHIGLAELLLDLGDTEGAAREITSVLNRDGNSVPAISLKGRVDLENHSYGHASQCFRSAIALDLGNPLLLVWDSYATYLGAELSGGLKDHEYRRALHSVVKELERAGKLCEDVWGSELRGFVLYFQGHVCYRAKDVFGAMEKLSQCVAYKSSFRAAARELLSGIWRCEIKPSWWRWWLCSPVHRWRKRTVFLSLCLLLLALLVLGFRSPIVNWIYPLRVDSTPYVFLVLLLFLLIFFPSIHRLKAKGIEVELRPPPPLEYGPSPVTMEENILTLEKWVEQKGKEPLSDTSGNS